MIRRETQLQDGEPGWMLISQVDHARLAWELAEHWIEPVGASTAANQDLLAAVLCHDDGWTAWERHPQVDSDSGRPIDFTEMALPQAIDIWRHSIAVADQKAAFTAWLVSRHFEELLRRSHWAESEDQNTIAYAKAFLQEQASAQGRWLSEWQSEDPTHHTAEAADAGLTLLQRFDLLSLWFCCAEQENQLTLDLPSGATLSLSPNIEHHVQIEPWPHGLAPCELSIAGRIVPQRHYRNADELAIAPSEAGKITWTLLPPKPTQ